MKLKTFATLQAGEAPMFQSGVVSIVEIIHSHDDVPGVQKQLRHSGSNEARTTRH